MKWFETKGDNQDVVLSTRIRLARNIVDYPFEPKLDEASSKEIIGKVKDIFEKEKGYKYIDFSKLTQNEKLSYSEHHIVSSEFARKNSPHALIENEDKQIYIMVCEEDHIRAQVIKSGLALDDALADISEVDNILDSNLKIAFSEELGYLTHCPTNLGTAMRASVMMFLPLMTMSGEINRLQYQLEKIGITIRGMSGEGSKPDGCLYQISNQVTLGISEEDIISKLKDVVEKVSKRERELRENALKDNELLIKDRIMRSFGIMNYAEMINSEEFIKLYADVRLGIALGFLKDLSYSAIDGLLFDVMPSTIACLDKKYERSTRERDQKRASIVKERLSLKKG